MTVNWNGRVIYLIAPEGSSWARDSGRGADDLPNTKPSGANLSHSA